MEDTERKVDSMYRKPSVAIAIGAVDLDIVEHKMLEFLNSPVGEHNPRENRVNEEEQSISDTGCDTMAQMLEATSLGIEDSWFVPVTALSARRADHGASCGTAAATHNSKNL